MNDRIRTRSTGLAGITNLSVLAPLRGDMVPGIEPMSYVGRLRKVLTALHTSRQNLRESELRPVFPDVVGRFGIIHNFRYALIKPEAGPKGMPAEFGTWRLSLNVTFDGGWEPYMRVIQRDIGPLLDLLFCHSSTYPGSKATFEEYCEWVRKHEVPAGLFYVDSGGTVTDGHYLSEAEALQRTGPLHDASLTEPQPQADALAGAWNELDRALSSHHQPSESQQQANALAAAWLDPRRALALPLRTLKGLYRLAIYFPPYADEEVLRRFAQDALRGPIDFMRRIEEGDPESEEGDPESPRGEQLARIKEEWERIKRLLPDELQWLQRDKMPQTAPTPPVLVNRKSVQAHVLADEKMTHGCLVLLQVKNKKQALCTIAKLAERCGPVAPGEIGYVVGFTYPGLQALGIAGDRLAALPQEFVEGMEARFGVLGDLRTNHPDRWTRPLLWGQEQSGQRADFHAVHLLVQMRLADTSNKGQEHPRLTAEVLTLQHDEQATSTGLRVLVVEPMRSYRDDDNGFAVGHMGIVDGVSQPVLRQRLPEDIPLKTKTYAHYDNEVSAGELLLGYANDRSDAAPARTNYFLKNGTFLAVRKLRQFMDRLDEVAPPGSALLTTMVGRAANGKPLHGLPADSKHTNDFRFEPAAASDACPFHSHIRRCNPRDGRQYTPRILRRGMSWGPRDADRTAPRGVMFMAYCSSIAEQFETIQRWVAGGNASGVGSAQGDPLLRVPKEGESYSFRYLAAGRVQRVKFSDQPLVQLQWGLYAFVPSIKALKKFACFTLPARAARSSNPQPGVSELEKIRALLEDRDKSETVWSWVRERSRSAPPGTPSAAQRGQSPAQSGAYGKLLGTRDEVLTALTDDGTQYSVHGYAERMKETIGLNLLGMDPSDARRKKELPVKGVIAGVTESDAFEAARPLAKFYLENIPELPSAPGDIVRRPVDLVDFSSWVIAQLCKQWFGLPDGNLIAEGGYQAGPPSVPPRCPGSLGPASRYMFMPHPQTELETEGGAHAKAVREAVGKWLERNPNLAEHRLSSEIKAALQKSGSEQYLADNIAGTMLGFTPSVHSNFLRVMETWLDEEPSLWVHQQSLFEASIEKDNLDYDTTKTVLRGELLAAICKHPVPTMAWRSPVVDGVPDTRPDQRVVLGLQSALADGAPQVLVFGRDHHETDKNTTVHGCPGYELAMGVLLAMVGSLMKAGTLRPTGSPVLLILTPPPATQAPPQPPQPPPS